MFGWSKYILIHASIFFFYVSLFNWISEFAPSASSVLLSNPPTALFAGTFHFINSCYKLEDKVNWMSTTKKKQNKQQPATAKLESCIDTEKMFYSTPYSKGLGLDKQYPIFLAERQISQNQWVETLTKCDQIFDSQGKKMDALRQKSIWSLLVIILGFSFAMIGFIVLPSFFPLFIRMFTFLYVMWCVVSPIVFTVAMIAAILVIQKRSREQALAIVKEIREQISNILNEENNTKYFARGVQLILKSRDFPGSDDDYGFNTNRRYKPLLPFPQFEIEVLLAQSFPVLAGGVQAVAQPPVQVQIQQQPETPVSVPQYQPQQEFYPSMKFDPKPMQKF